MSKESPFYVIGGTLPQTAECYVERSADSELFEGVRAGDYVYVLDARQMGKSSLSVRALKLLSENGVKTALLDLTKYGVRNLTAEQWFAALLRDLGRSLGISNALADYWKSTAGDAPVQRFFGALRDVALEEISGPVAIFIDEIDITRSLPFDTDEFFLSIRQCFVGRANDERLNRLSFVLFGTAAPTELIQDTRISPFNIGRRVDLNDFGLDEASVLSRFLPGNGKDVLRRVLHWTGGHPYLTQRMCQAIAGMGPSANVDQVCRSLFFDAGNTESDNNLAFVRNRLLRSDVDLVSLLDVYTEVRAGKKVSDSVSNPLCTVLKMSGVVRERGGLLQIRNRIYERVFDRAWIEEQLPNAEVRRQKAAYRRGIWRAGLIAGSVAVAFAALAGYAVDEARLEHEALVRAKVMTGTVAGYRHESPDPEHDAGRLYLETKQKLALVEGELSNERSARAKDEAELKRLRPSFPGARSRNSAGVSHL